MTVNETTDRIISAAIEVHRTLGPGLIESIYKDCVCRELTLRHIPHERRRPLPVEFKGDKINSDFCLDLVVADQVVLEIKSVEILLPLHDAQILTYMKLGGWKVGLLINFNVPLLKNGIRRKVLNLERSQDICLTT